MKLVLGQRIELKEKKVGIEFIKVDQIMVELGVNKDQENMLIDLGKERR